MKRRCWPVVLLIVLLFAPLPGMAGVPGTSRASTGQDASRITAGPALSLNTSRTAESSAPTLAASSAGRGSGSLDLALVIDTTGSMVPYIASVRAAATAITNQILSAVPDSRIAVEAYRDYPIAPYGEPTDYLYQDAQSFTSDPALIDSAINGLAVTGGNDTPESLFCALMHAIRADRCADHGPATTLGAWRPAARKFIIYMTDAPAHSPEPFTGFTIADVVSAAKSAGLSVQSGVGILPIHVGNDLGALADATSLAKGTGGTVFPSPSPGDAVIAIKRAIKVVVKPQPPRVVTHKAVVVLVPGLASHTGDGYFTQFESLLKNTFAGTSDQGTGLAGADMVEYGYKGPLASGSHPWEPQPYECDATFTHTLTQDADNLRATIDAYLAAHQNANVYLVGHSQGGLVILAYLASLDSGSLGSSRWTVKNGTLRAAVTLDSPLGGIPSPQGLNVAKNVLSSKFACPRMGKLKLPFTDLKQFNQIAGTDHADRYPRGGQASVASVLYGASETNQQVADDAAAHGVRLLTIGNLHDLLYMPCLNIKGWWDPNIDTQWLAEPSSSSAGPFGRVVTLGSAPCIKSFLRTHTAILSDSLSVNAIARFLLGGNPVSLALPPLPDLSVTSTGVRAENVAAAQFTVTLTNQGHGEASGVLLRDRVTGASSLPTITADNGLQCGEAPARETPGIYVFDCTGTLQPFESRTITILAPVNSGAPGNIAVADPDHTTGDTNTSNNEAYKQVFVY